MIGPDFIHDTNLLDIIFVVVVVFIKENVFNLYCVAYSNVNFNN